MFLAVYIVFVGGGYLIFLLYGLEHIPGPFLGEHHRFIAHFSIMLTFAWFYHLIHSDPGTITASNVEYHLKKFPFDDMMYRPNFCKTCNIPRPARSRHCGTCNRCIARFDHHCPWVNNDIGAKNTWKFLVYLFGTGLLCTYCSYVCFCIFRGYVHENDLWEKGYVDSSGNVTTLSIFVLMQFILNHNSFLFALMIFTGFVSFVMYIFTAYQCFLIAQNLTSSESLKLHDLRNFIETRGGQIPLEELQNFTNSQMVPIEPEQRQELEKMAHLIIKDNNRQSDPITKRNLVNIYDKGILTNFYKVLTNN